MTKFSERLKELRTSNNLTQKQIADKLGIRQQSYARYELGTGEPNIETLIGLTKIFAVSADVLLGITDY
jgi:transcriptional regulator with XRE-family HTH domain